MVSMAESVKQYKRSKSKRKTEIKSLKKQNKILYIITNKSGSRREIKNIKKIRAKDSKKRRDDRINSSSDNSDSNSYLSRDSN